MIVTNADFNDYAWNHGQLDPETAWILHPFDIWLKNPHYAGPPVKHPEDYQDHQEEHDQ